MVVRIRFRRGPRIRKQRPGNRKFALAAGVFLTPAAVMACALALWRVAADLNWANRFAIPSGLFSHWQVWLAAAVLLQVCSRILNRWGKGGDAATS